jgi:hypothetical protein
MTLLFATLGAIATIGAVFALERFLTWRSRHLDRLMECRDVFFRAAKNLLADDETPPLIVDQLEFMGKSIASARIGRMLLWAALRGDLRRSVRNPSQHVRDVRLALSRMRPELRKQYTLAITGMIFAATFMNVFLGSFLRRAILFWITGNDDEPQNAEFIVTDAASMHSQRELVA